MTGRATALSLRIIYSLVTVTVAGIPTPASAQSILPPAPDAIGGGNPLQGLGRPDDPGPSRMDQFKPPGTIDTSGEGSDTASNTTSSTASGTTPGEAPNTVQIQGNQNQGQQNQAAGAPNAESPGSLPPEPDASARFPGQIPGQIPGQPDQLQQAQPPGRPDTPLGRALSLIDRKKFATAAESLQEIIRKEPDNPVAHYLMAVTQVYLRNNEEARIQYRWVIEHSPDEKIKELARRGLAKLSP
ncbi:MAG: hypothetical protein IPM23_25895 [Candidatus Melainabacteria bacterium]|nr:hypothetical protein [Candidatus Melainabacteria bacterium]